MLKFNKIAVVLFAVFVSNAVGYCTFCNDFIDSTVDTVVSNTGGDPSMMITFIDLTESLPEVGAMNVLGDAYSGLFGGALDQCSPQFVEIPPMTEEMFDNMWIPHGVPETITTQVWFSNNNGHWDASINCPIDYFGYGTQGNSHNDYYTGHISYMRQGTTEPGHGIWIRVWTCVAVYINEVKVDAWCGNGWHHIPTTMFGDGVYEVDIFYTGIDAGIMISDHGMPVDTKCQHVEVTNPNMCMTSADCCDGHACVNSICTECMTTMCGTAVIGDTSCAITPVVGMAGEACSLSTEGVEKYCSTTGMCVTCQHCVNATTDCPQPGYICVNRKCVALTREYVARFGLGSSSAYLLSVDHNIVWNMTAFSGPHPSVPSTSAYWTAAGRESIEERIAHHGTASNRDPTTRATSLIAGMRCRGPSDCTPTTTCTTTTRCVKGVCLYDGPGNAPVSTPCRIGIGNTDINYGYGICDGLGTCVKGTVTSSNPSECPSTDPLMTPCKGPAVKTLHYMQATTVGLQKYYCNYTVSMPKGTPCSPAIGGGSGLCTAGGDCVSV